MGKKYQLGSVCLCIEHKDYFFVGARGWHKHARKEEESDSHVEKMDEKRWSWRTNNLGCAQRECKPNDIIIEEWTKMFESRISAGATEKLPRRKKSHAKTAAWFYDM